jgi:hypothetical protein
MEPEKFTFIQFDGTIFPAVRDVSRWGCMWVFVMVGGLYLARQATALLRFASSTTNQQLAAVLVEKAADLKSQADEAMPSHDVSPRAPDVEMSFPR